MSAEPISAAASEAVNLAETLAEWDALPVERRMRCFWAGDTAVAPMVARIRALEAEVARKDAALRGMIAAHTWHENAPTPYVTWEGLEAERASKAAALVQARAAVEGRSDG